MTENHSITADFHWPFSGSSPPSAVDVHDNNRNGHGAPFPLSVEAARAALLQLRVRDVGESVTSADFKKIINGVTSESTSSETISEVDFEA